MNHNIVIFIIGWVVQFEALFMLFPAMIALLYKEQAGWIFLICTLLFFPLGFFITKKKPKDTSFYAREGFLVVALSWFVISLIGAIPFFASGEIPTVIDALFEMISGFTTTGATMVMDIEAMSKCMLFWRSFSHWIGGMGVLLFIMAIMPLVGGHNIHLMKAETTGFSTGKWLPKMRKIAFLLYTIYFSLTGLQFLFLIIGKMPLFDAICVTFSTAGTGGFGIWNSGFVDYSFYAQVITMIFLLLFGVNFTFYYLMLTKQFKEALKNEEVRYYFILFILASIFITFNLWSHGTGFAESLKYATFQTSSILSSTAFVMTDFSTWPTFSKMLLMILMFVGACSGSTGGGIKISRFIIYIKAVHKELQILLYPRSVKVLKMNGKIIEHEVVRSVNIFLLVYILIFTGATLIVSLDGYDLMTTVTAVSATLNNVGLDFRAIGLDANYAMFSLPSKIVFMFNMLAGRLELFPILLLFSKSTWTGK